MLTDQEIQSTVIVTGADAQFFDYALQTIQSIQSLPGQSYRIGLLDAGFTTEQIEQCAQLKNVTRIPLDWPSYKLKMKAMSKSSRLVNLYKSKLNLLFPHSEYIVWIDADAWLQNDLCLQHAIAVAKQDKLAVVSQATRLQKNHLTMRRSWLGLIECRGILFKNAKRAGLPKKIVDDLMVRPVLNAGFYALKTKASHWSMWHKLQSELALKGRIFSSDQLSLAITIYLERLPYEALSDVCNYMGPWRYDTDQKKFTDLYYPYQPVSLVHMAGVDKSNPVSHGVDQYGNQIDLQLSFSKQDENSKQGRNQTQLY